MVKEGREGPARGNSSRRSLTEGDFHRLHPKLIAMFRRAGASSEEARDLAQETLLQAHRGLASFHEHSRLDTWVCSIAKHVWLHHWRARGRQKRRLEGTSPGTSAASPEPKERSFDPEDRLIARDMIDHARRAIAALPEAMRRALLLHVHGHKYRAIAVLLGVNENHVSSLIHQAREKIRSRTHGLPASSEP
jgi:RNA polymerase sigma-70 factor (ECF subfamily)